MYDGYLARVPGFKRLGIGSDKKEAEFWNRLKVVLQDSFNC